MILVEEEETTVETAFDDQLTLGAGHAEFLTWTNSSTAIESIKNRFVNRFFLEMAN